MTLFFYISAEELQCMATWKDGRNKYLVGTVKSVGRSIMASNEDMFRWLGLSTTHNIHVHLSLSDRWYRPPT